MSGVEETAYERRRYQAQARRKARPATAETPTMRAHRQLQELYRVLDHSSEAGNIYLAWYGQLRAQEVPHADAIEQTVEHWGLRRKAWWPVRFPSGDWR